MKYQPSFYLWVLSTQTGEVDLADAHESHPLDVKDHKALANERGEANLIHGYAGRIEGGWRICDLNGRAIDDPYVRKMVVRALSERLGENVKPTSDPLPADFDFDRTQYGRPMSTVQTDGSELA